MPTSDGKAIYLGSPVSQADQDHPDDSERRRDYFVAIEKIGTNGLHILLRRLQSKDSRLTRTYRKWSDNLLRRTPQQFPTSTDTRRFQALTAIYVIGAGAKPLVPDLIRLANDEDLDVSACALQALRFVQRDEYEKAKVQFETELLRRVLQQVTNAAK